MAVRDLGAWTADSIVYGDINTFDAQDFTLITAASWAGTVDIIRSGAVYKEPSLAIGTDDTQVQIQNAIAYAISGTGHTKATTDGVDFPTETILADDWGLFVLHINAAGTYAITGAAGNEDGSYASEADALGALAATVAGLAATEHPVAYITVQTDSGQSWTGQTDSPEGGASGNPSDDTNYYTFYDGDATNSNALIAFDNDEDSVTGLHSFTADNSGGELGWANGDICRFRLTAGTVDTISRVGLSVWSWGIATDGFTTQQSTDAQTAAAAALQDIDLDHLFSQPVTSQVSDNSALAKLVDNQATASWSNYNNETMSLRASAIDLDDILDRAVSFTVGSSSLSSTTCSTDLDEADDTYNGRVVIFLTGDAAGQAALISDFANSNGVLTFSTLPATTPAENDTGIIV